MSRAPSNLAEATGSVMVGTPGALLGCMSSRSEGPSRSGSRPSSSAVELLVVCADERGKGGRDEGPSSPSTRASWQRELTWRSARELHGASEPLPARAEGRQAPGLGPNEGIAFDPRSGHSVSGSPLTAADFHAGADSLLCSGAMVVEAEGTRPARLLVSLRHVGSSTVEVDLEVEARDRMGPARTIGRLTAFSIAGAEPCCVEIPLAPFACEATHLRLRACDPVGQASVVLTEVARAARTSR